MVVMWATDGSDTADRTLDHARTLATEGNGALVAVYVEEFTFPGKGGGSLPIHANEETVQAKLGRQVAELSEAGASAGLEILTSHVGNAGNAIAELAEKEQADVIVAGTRGQTALVGLLLGSATQRLLQIAPCPVLAVRTRHQ
jgi:nucleotide-binding universal stress UspA family protein